MEPYVDESEDPPIDDTQDPENFVQPNPSNGDGSASHHGMEGFIDSVPPNPIYGDSIGARDDGAFSSQGTLGTQDTEQDHQGGLVDINEQLVEPNGQDEANPGGAQEEGEEGEEGAAAGGGGNFDLEGGLTLTTLRALSKNMVIMDPLPPDHFAEMIPMMMDIVHQHPQFRGPYVG